MSPANLDRPRLGDERRDRDRLAPDRVDDVPLPGVAELVELERRQGGGVGAGAAVAATAPARGRRPPPARVGRRCGVGDDGERAPRGRGSPRAAPCGPRLEQLEPVGERVAREVGLRARDLDERELERQPRVAALAHVVDGDREQVDQAQHGRLGQLVRLLAEALARLLGDAAATRARGRRAARGGAGGDARSARSTSRPMSCPCSASSSIWTSAPAVSRSTIVSQSRKSESSSIPPTSWSTSWTEIVLPGRGGELVERRDGVAERAVRAARDQRERRVGRVDLLALADAPQHGDELLQARPLEDERLAARADGRQHAREVGRAEDEDEVGRRLLDQLQQRVPGLRGELVRLVDDVDLVAALDRLQHGALADLADVVDAALRGGVHLDHVERAAVRDRLARRGRRGRSRRSGRPRRSAPWRGSAPATSCRCRAGPAKR